MSLLSFFRKRQSDWHVCGHCYGDQRGLCIRLGKCWNAGDLKKITRRAEASLSEAGHGTDADFDELRLLYRYKDDDSRQFTRWQMVVAIRHGRTLATPLKEGE